MAISLAEEKVRAARAKAAYLRPYFAHALYALILVEQKHCPTMAVDTFGRLYYGPDFVMEKSIEELTTVFLHEIGHVLRDHAKRARALGVTWLTHQIANLAEDAELNDDLAAEIQERLDLAPLPGPTRAQLEEIAKRLQCNVTDVPDKAIGPVYPWKIDCEDDDVWEVYYGKLMDRINDLDIYVIGGGGNQPATTSGTITEGGKTLRIHVHQCGSGAHNVRMPWEEAEPASSGTEGVSAADWSDIKRLTAEAIDEHEKTRGNVPAGWKAWANEMLKPQRIPWDQELAGNLRWAANDVAGAVFHSYKRPSRRQNAVPNVIFPSMRRHVPFICMIGDTSGSMSDTHELPLVRGVVEDICYSLGARIAFLATDAAVHGGIQTVHDGRSVELLGRGGTNMAAGIDYALNNLRPKPDVLVIATDCDTPWPEKDPGIKTVVCAINASASDLAVIPDWMKVIIVNPAETSRDIDAA